MLAEGNPRQRGTEGHDQTVSPSRLEDTTKGTGAVDLVAHRAAAVPAAVLVLFNLGQDQ